MRSLFAVLLIALLLLPLAGYADDEVDDDRKVEALVTRIFNVRALTSGRPDFWGGEPPASGRATIAEERPLFGAEAEEPVYPYGQVDELIELIQMHVRPESWESTLGAGIWSSGETTLVVRSFQDIVDEVAKYLATLERRGMRRVTVDVQALRLTSAQVRSLLQEGSSLLADPERLEAVRAAGASGPGVSLTAYERHRALVFHGGQRAFVCDYDVEVAQDSTISDPIISVANLGFSVDVLPILGPEGRSVMLWLRGFLADLESTRTIDTGDGRLVELPAYALARLQSKVEIPVGAWALIEGRSTEAGDAHWVFAVRGRREQPEGLTDTARGVVLEAPAARPSRRFELRTFDVGMLGSAVDSSLGRSISLMPSNFTPPEPPELPEPAPLFAVDSIVDLIRESIMPASWELKGAFIDARNGYIYVRNSPAVLDAIGRQLGILRREFIWSVALTAEAVEVDEALARRLESAPGRALDAKRRKPLDAALAADQAKALGTVRVTTMAGSRNAATSGRDVSYLGDYEVELAQGSKSADPVIYSCLSGGQLDAQAVLCVGGKAVHVTLRYVRTHLREPLRKISTPHGEIDVPQLDVFRTHCALQMPLGRTTVVSAGGDGTRRRLLLITPQLRRASE